MKAPAGAPWIVGVAHFACGTLPYPLSRRDIERDSAWAVTVYERLGLQAGQMIHLIGDGAEEVSWWPFENAAMRLHIPWIQAESGAFDTSRTDMVIRRFKLQAILGLSTPVLDALLALGRDPRQFFGGLRAVVAAPAAARKLAALSVPAWTLLQIGPVFAFEPPAGGGARYDESEWRVDAIDGELALSSVNARAAPFAKLRSGLRGRVEIVDSERRVFLE
ncbi:hypothetical protein [Hydrocarboniphaga sp.]|uniref:hypothetical protein n=1 Tax=Hydrocarboniphaga sp. TaxID=2033016 RepID=UPI00262761A0|nr:hypothetical protein [Hydrocarboniphaga sp.]